MEPPKPFTAFAQSAYAGRNVLLTGASSGIGEQLALALNRLGARVVLVARRRKLLEALAAKLRANGAQAWALPADLVKADAVALVRSAEKKAGPLDYVFSCAAFFDISPFGSLSPQRIADTVRLNTAFPILLTHALLPGFRARGRGQLVHIASLAGLQPLPYYQVYTATKHALIAFCRSLEVELEGSGIRLTVVLPSGVRTPMAARYEAVASKLGTHFFDPDEVARRTLEAAARGRFLVRLGLKESLLIRLGALFPFLQRPALLHVKRGIERHLFPTAPGAGNLQA